MNIYIVAGEKSGDTHASLLMRELRSQRPDLEFFGLGGGDMHTLSPHVEDWLEQSAVMGLVEVLRHYSYFRRKFFKTLEEIKHLRPECLILVDYSGFNLRLAKQVRKVCPKVKIAYFISPQVWAWKKGRIKMMVQTLDLMMCIFPFEKPLFERAGLKTEFVGHPLVDEIKAMRREGGRDQNLIGLFPGSRAKEIERIFPVLLDAAERLQSRHPEWKFEVAATNEKLAEQMEKIMRERNKLSDIVSIRLNQYHELMERANIGVVASGTATLEAALHCMPYVLVYKLAWLTYIVARQVVKIPYVGMVNILAGREVVKELLQENCSIDAVVKEVERLMSPSVWESVVAEMNHSTDKLGQGGAASHAARAVLNLVNI